MGWKIDLELKNLSLLPDLILRILSVVPAYVIQNLAKARMLKLVFWNLNLDKVEGAYVEFGVASGNSMRMAEIAERTTAAKSLGVSRVQRNLYGFDTFNGFSSSFAGDKHEIWSGTNFSIDIDKVKKRFKSSGDKVKLFKLDASNLGFNYAGEKVSDYVHDEFIAVVLFDMDLCEPTYNALEFIKSKLIPGSVLIFDEYNGFKSDENLGEFRAMTKFLNQNKNFKVRTLMKYSIGAEVFQVLST